VLKDTPTIVTPSGVEGLRFTDEADAVNRYVPELERKGVQTIVALVHQGGFQTGYLNECKGLNGPIVDITKRLDPAVSVVFSGHTHQAYNCRVDGKVLIQGALYGKVISDVNLVFDKATRDLVGVSSKNVPVTQDVAPDPQVKALVDDYTERAAPLANRVVGSVSTDLTRQQTSAGESGFGDVIADAQLEATAPAFVGGAQNAHRVGRERQTRPCVPPPAGAGLMGLRTTQFFLAGLLDTVSGINGRVVDGRRNIYDGAPSEIDPSGEIRRARQLVSCAALWASGQLDVVDPHDRQQLPNPDMARRDRSNHFRASPPARSAREPAARWRCGTRPTGAAHACHVRLTSTSSPASPNDDG